MLTKPPRWALYPDASAEPGLWRDLLFSMPLWEGAGLPMDLRTRQSATQSNVSWASNSSGLILDAAGSTSRDLRFTAPPDVADGAPYPCTIGVVLSFTTTANQVVFENDGNDFSLQVYQGRTLFTAGTTDKQAFTSGTQNDGSPHCVVFCLRSTMSQTKIFTDGADDTGTLETDPSSPALTTTWNVFSRAGSAGFHGAIGMIHLLGRDIGDDLAQRWSADPWLPWRQRDEAPVWAFIPAAAGGGTTVNVTEDTLTLTPSTAFVDETLNVTEGTLTFTTSTAFVDEVINTTEASLNFSASTAFVDETINVTESSLSFTASTATIADGNIIEVTEDTLTFTASTAFVDEVINITEQSLTFTASAATVRDTIQVSEGTLTFTASSVTIDETIPVTEDSLTFTASAVTISDGTGVDPPNIDGQASVTISSNYGQVKIYCRGGGEYFTWTETVVIP